MRIYYIEREDYVTYYQSLEALEEKLDKQGFEMYQDFLEDGNSKRIYHSRKNDFSDILKPTRLTVGWIDTED